LKYKEVKINKIHDQKKENHQLLSTNIIRKHLELQNLNTITILYLPNPINHNPGNPPLIIITQQPKTTKGYAKFHHGVLKDKNFKFKDGTHQPIRKGQNSTAYSEP
jgi:hypothetical protein